MGVVQSRVWKIENGRLLPTEKDVRAWVRAAGGGDATAETLLGLLAGARSEQAFGTAFRKPDGAVTYQEDVRATEQQSTRIGEFQVAVIPGLLQTADYARELLSVVSGPGVWGVSPEGIEGIITSRLRRQEVLFDHSKHVQIVLGEGALRTRVVSPATLAAQLDKLLSVVRLPAVELGVIGFGQRMPAYPLGFRVYDDDLIVVESIADEKPYTDPGDVKAFLDSFDALQRAASTGDEAEAIIQRALEDLQ
jgi:hypothetical protein